MPNLDKLQQLWEELKSKYRAIINMPVTFDFILGIVDYVEFIQKSPMLAECIEKEHEDLRLTRRKIPKARTDKEYEMMGRILGEKLYTNCSEDFMELVFIQEALQHRRESTPAEDMAPIEIRMEYDLWELEKNRAKETNYYFQHIQYIRRSIQKVQTYLEDELLKLKDIEEKKIGFTEKGLRFDDIEGILYINGAAVKIKGQKKITWEYRILKHMFDSDDLSQEFFYSEINDDGMFAKVKMTRYTTACENIQKKVLKQLGIGDFLIFTHSKKEGKVQINPKYLN